MFKKFRGLFGPVHEHMPEHLENQLKRTEVSLLDARAKAEEWSYTIQFYEARIKRLRGELQFWKNRDHV
jgi:hypothetical protein